VKIKLQNTIKPLFLSIIGILFYFNGTSQKIVVSKLDTLVVFPDGTSRSFDRYSVFDQNLMTAYNLSNKNTKGSKKSNPNEKSDMMISKQQAYRFTEKVAALNYQVKMNLEGLASFESGLQNQLTSKEISKEQKDSLNTNLNAIRKRIKSKKKISKRTEKLLNNSLKMINLPTSKRNSQLPKLTEEFEVLQVQVLREESIEVHQEEEINREQKPKVKKEKKDKKEKKEKIELPPSEKEIEQPITLDVPFIQTNEPIPNPKSTTTNEKVIYTAPKYEEPKDLMLNPPKQKCIWAFRGKDEFNGKERSDLNPAILFSYTDDRLRSSFIGTDYMICNGYFTKVSGGLIYLTLYIEIKSEQALKNFGSLEKGALMSLKTISGEKIDLYNARTENGVYDHKRNVTTYKPTYNIAPNIEKILRKELPDKIRIVWNTGYEDYPVTHLDFFKNQLECLNE
jgi:hypothetical protein